MARVAVLLWCTQSHNTDHLQSKRNSCLLELLERDIGRGRCIVTGLEYRGIRIGMRKDKDGDEEG